MKTLITSILLVLALTGCSKQLYQEQLAEAVSACWKREGTYLIEISTFNTINVKCKDGTNWEIKQ